MGPSEKTQVQRDEVTYLFKVSHTAPKPGLQQRSLKVKSRALCLVLHLFSLAEACQPKSHTEEDRHFGSRNERYGWHGGCHNQSLLEGKIVYAYCSSHQKRLEKNHYRRGLSDSKIRKNAKNIITIHTVVASLPQ